MNNLISPPLSPWELGEINLALKRYFGTEFDDRQKYRVVWANHQMEKRCGTYNEFCGPLFLRTVTGFKEVFKYPMAKNLYVFERILYYPMQEVIGSENGVYESVYIFERNGEYQQPVLDKCIALGRFLEMPKVKLTEKDFADDERKRFEKDIETMTDILGEEGHRWMFYPGETGKQGVFLNSKEQKAWK